MRRVASSGPKTLTSIGLFDARQVVDLVLHQRHEFGLQFGDLVLELLAELVEDLLHRPALAGGLEADEDVAGVRLGGEETELGARPADVARDVGRRRSTSSTRRSTLSVWASEVPTGML